MPTKRLALFYDGTNNAPSDNTNVWRSYQLLAPTASDGVPQLKHYIEGVGNEFGVRLRGSLFGEGVARKMREGYEWLVANYEDGTEIYIFGFSRGAFTARSLVQLISYCGLTRPEAAPQWSSHQALERYEAISREEAQPIWKLRRWQRHPGETPPGFQPNAGDKILLDDAKVRIVKVRMAGLWDTVGAIGTDAMSNDGALTQKSATFNVRPTKAQDYGYHAIAIDDHRPMFDVTLWRTFVETGKLEDAAARYNPYYEQRWFIGAHSDVGGGYHDDRLPDLSLRWMQQKAAALGLSFTGLITPKPEGWRAPIHDSFKAFGFGILNIWSKIIPGDQRNYRQIYRAPREVTAETGTAGALWSINEQIDESVFARWQNDSQYRPPSLVECFKRNPQLMPGPAKPPAV